IPSSNRSPRFALLSPGFGLLRLWTDEQAHAGHSSFRASAAGLLAPEEVQNLNRGWSIFSKARSNQRASPLRSAAPTRTQFDFCFSTSCLGKASFFGTGCCFQRRHLSCSGERWLCGHRDPAGITSRQCPYLVCEISGQSDLANSSGYLLSALPSWPHERGTVRLAGHRRRFGAGTVIVCCPLAFRPSALVECRLALVSGHSV